MAPVIHLQFRTKGENMRVLYFLILFLLGVTSAAESRQTEVGIDRDGNVKVFQGLNAWFGDFVKQTGQDNRMYLYQIIPSAEDQDSIDVRQDGKENKILSLITGKKPFHQLLKQRGEKNSIHILQTSKGDSTSKGKTSVSVQQKGNGNRVKVIQN